MKSPDYPSQSPLVEAPLDADILIVDDTLENLVLLAKILEVKGYNVRKALNGKLAKSAIRAKKPDLILLDICMPELDGYELCQQLKADEATTDIPIIFLSALSDVQGKVKAFSVGGVDYITKPFESAEVLVRVQTQLLARQTWEKMQAIIEEQTEALRIANQRLKQIAYEDNLTGLPNRAALVKLLQGLLEAVKENPDYQFAVLFCDCDRFKPINDSFGHLIGDQILIQLAERLRDCLDEQHILARFSGDEFVVVLPQINDQTEAMQVAEKLLEVVRPRFRLEHSEAFMSLSIGIALSNAVQHQKPENILRDADIAMYNAKTNGKGCYSLFSPIMRRISAELLQVETDLHRAIAAQEEFIPYYQSIVNLDNQQPIGLEVLMRWQHPEQGVLRPHSFISVAEETGLIAPIGKLLLEAACQDLAQWRSQNKVNDDFYLSFNLSVSQLTQANLPQELKKTLENYQLSAKHLRLEITETALLDNALAINVVRQLSEAGFHLCIDDFGTGYSSFSYLCNMPVKTLKIDRSFVQELTLESRNHQIISAILNIVKSLDMVAVSEGIETSEQSEILRQIDCELGQGYFFSKPIPAEKVIQEIFNKSVIELTL